MNRLERYPCNLSGETKLRVSRRTRVIAVHESQHPNQFCLVCVSHGEHARDSTLVVRAVESVGHRIGDADEFAGLVKVGLNYQYIFVERAE